MRLAIALTLLLAGCAQSWAALPADDPRRLSVAERHDREWARTHPSPATQEDQALNELLTRARFDLQCPEATTVPLERHSSGPLVLVGASGCGRQAEYRRRLRRNGWGRFTTENTRWDRAQGGTVFVAVD